MKAGSAIWSGVLKTAEIITDHSGEDEVGLDNTVTLYVRRTMWKRHTGW